MGNKNCLAGVKCPKCGALEPFRIHAQVIVRVYDSGTENISGDIDWNDDSSIVCDACEFSGTVNSFIEGGEEENDTTD